MHADSPIISLDLLHERTATLDLNVFFPLSELHAIHGAKRSVENIGPKKRRKIDLSLPEILSLPRFTNYRALDIGPKELARKRKLMMNPSKFADFRVLDLVPPLSIPYGSLDVRSEPIPSTRTYPDIYRRTLPVSLHLKRIQKSSFHFLRKHRRSIVSFSGLFLLLSLPVIFYTKYLIENGYNQLLSLRTSV
jgi:hypothetical protein